MEISSGKPYIDNGNIRTFKCSTNDDEFVWHRDEQERRITVLTGQGWRLQYNGDLPIELIEGKEYHIPAMLFHRVFKGATDLVIRIEKL